MVAEDANDKHMGPWAEACQQHGVENTPLTPFIHQELLDKKHLHLDNEKLKATGFSHIHPFLTKQSLQQVSSYVFCSHENVSLLKASALFTSSVNLKFSQYFTLCFQKGEFELFNTFVCLWFIFVDYAYFYCLSFCNKIVQ